MNKYILVMIVLFVITLTACGDDKELPECRSDTHCEIGSICSDGICEMVFCPEIFDPVCGVDGITYSNECFAGAAHVEVDHVGECVPEE